MTAIKAARGRGPQTVLPHVQSIMDFHGLSQRHAQFVANWLEETGFDFEEYDEGALQHDAGLMIDWINKNGDWP